MLDELQWMFIILYNVSWKYSGWIHKLCYLGMVFLKVLKLTSCLVKRNGHINNKSNYACHLIPILRVTLRFKLLHVKNAHFSTKCFKQIPKKPIFIQKKWIIHSILISLNSSLKHKSCFSIVKVLNWWKSSRLIASSCILELWFSQQSTIYKVKINF